MIKNNTNIRTTLTREEQEEAWNELLSIAEKILNENDLELLRESATKKFSKVL